ncbi:hypothetical protein [Dactylosporangium sp. CA-139066]|uniref:hypothetical protein n=1 Tax=Dactylosporangium sp. CA-139066 TaxID=3239930 RepID=UPI003D8B7D79
MRIRLLAALATATLTLPAGALAGCDGSSPGAAATTAAGAGNRAALADAAQCMRANGFPDYPDPVETNGTWAFPQSAADMAQKPAPECTDLFRRAGALPGPAGRAVTPEELVKLRKWGDCIRANGLPDWPDPDADGIFHPQPAAPAEDDPRWVKADTACRGLEPGPISVDAGAGARKTG